MKIIEGIDSKKIWYCSPTRHYPQERDMMTTILVKLDPHFFQEAKTFSCAHLYITIALF
jgi:hypothetical protein